MDELSERVFGDLGSLRQSLIEGNGLMMASSRIFEGLANLDTVQLDSHPEDPFQICRCGEDWKPMYKITTEM